jgi:hypothetical protein
MYNTLSLRSSLNVSDQIKEDAIRNKNRANYKYEWNLQTIQTEEINKQRAYTVFNSKIQRIRKCI